jgi:hypothetical protein
MSLSKLSSELDSIITGFLHDDQKALDALSKVSRHYRAVAEPYLYETLKFNEHNRTSLVKLFLTLVRRNELALHIKTFIRLPTLPELVDKEWIDMQFLRIRVGEAVDTVHREVDRIMSPMSVNTAAVAMKLFKEVLGPDFVGTVLALTMCFAKNVEDIYIVEQRNWTLRPVWDALSFDWTQCSSPSFAKLRSLSTVGCSDIHTPPPVHLPSMTRLMINRSDLGQFHFNPAYPFYRPVSPQIGTEPVLQSLLLISTPSVGPEFVQSLGSFPWLRNLKELTIRSAAPATSTWDLPGLLRALERHTPSLEAFEWSRSNITSQPIVFDTFKGLRNLRRLTVDLGLLCNPLNDVLEELDELGETLPEHLEEVAIHRISRDQYGELVDRVGQALEDMEVCGLDAGHAPRSWFSRTPIKHLVLVVVMRIPDDEEPGGWRLLELEPTTVSSVQAIADDLYQMGVTLKVFRDLCL